MRAAWYFALMFPVADVFGAVALGSVIGIGAWWGPEWGLDQGGLVACVFLTSLILQPIGEIGEVLDQTQTAVAGWRKVLDLLDERAGAAGAEAAAAAYADDAPLDTPIEDEFRVSTLSLAWDPDRPSVVIEATPEEDGAEEQGPEREGVTPTEGLRVTMSPAQARAFARRAQALISAGRPPCPFCGGPLDPQGHVCPRANGYRR
jgi:uncharacterized repeat protein (TIGR03847 family)